MPNYGKEEESIRFMVGEAEGKRTLGRSRRTCEVNITVSERDRTGL